MTTTSERQFGPEFPANCPPSTVTDAKGTIYRLVKKTPPDASDFQTHAELGLAPTAEPCDRCGLSVYAIQSDAVAMFLRVAERYGVDGTRIGRFVARLCLTAEHGRLLSTPNRTFHDSHHTWWPYSGADRLSSCDQIVEDASNALGT